MTFLAQDKEKGDGKENGSSKNKMQDRKHTCCNEDKSARKLPSFPTAQLFISPSRVAATL